MLTANLPPGQVPGAKDDPNDALLLNTTAGSFLSSPGRCLFGDDTIKSMYPDPPTGSNGPIIGSDADLYSLNPAFPSITNFDSSADMLSTSTSRLDSKTPASTLSSKSQSKPTEPTPPPPPKRETSKRKTGKQKQTAETEKSSAPAKTRRQPKRESRRTTRAEEPAKKPTRRERSLERNRVAASKCRKRKKAWTEKLEEKKSGLEAMHNELQSQYLSLLQESSHLKNHLITHAGCHDPNIDVWINNEASKYVRRLSGENPHRPRSMQSLPSLDNHSTWHSSANSQYTGISEGSPTINEDDSNEEDEDEDKFDGDFGENMF